MRTVYYMRDTLHVTTSVHKQYRVTLTSKVLVVMQGANFEMMYFNTHVVNAVHDGLCRLMQLARTKYARVPEFCAIPLRSCTAHYCARRAMRCVPLYQRVLCTMTSITAIRHYSIE